jgi:predicted oxidoreductase
MQQALNLSPLAAGTMTWGEWGADYDTSTIAGLIESCLEEGITTFDHADIYGNYTTEAAFGKALHQLGTRDRAHLQLITKCGIQLVTHHRPGNRVKHYDSSRDHIIASAERSLRNLRTEYIDLLLIHRPDPLMEAEQVAAAFDQLRQSGKVRHFGVSNFTPEQFGWLNAHTPLVTNQVECHPRHPGPLFDGTYRQCQRVDIRPMVWSPLGGRDYFEGAGTQVLRLREVASQVAKNYGTTEDVILLAWCRKHPSRPIPVLGTTKTERLRRATECLDIDLDRQSWYTILEAGRGYEVA